MSLTGAFLVLFVTFHVLMNAVAIFWPSAYNVVCEFLGANWYALVGTAVLAAGFLLHIIYAIWLTIQNRKARGNDRYAVVSKPAQVEWSSQNMLVLGFVVIAFIGLHLVQFWAKMQLAEITGNLATVSTPCGHEMPLPPAAGTLFLQLAFGQVWTLPLYLIGLVALWFHMTHGFWSMFQSCGWNNQIWIDRLKKAANWWTTIVIALFAIEAVVFTVQANKGAYVKCPELQGQYQKMLDKHFANPMAGCEVVDCEDVVLEEVEPCCGGCDAVNEGCCGKCENNGESCGENKDCCGKCENNGGCDAVKEGCCGKCENNGGSCGESKEGCPKANGGCCADGKKVTNQENN